MKDGSAILIGGKRPKESQFSFDHSSFATFLQTKSGKKPAIFWKKKILRENEMTRENEIFVNARCR